MSRIQILTLLRFITARRALFAGSILLALSVIFVRSDHRWLHMDLERDRLMIGPIPFSGIVLEASPREWTITSYWLGRVNGIEARVSRTSWKLVSWRPYLYGKKVGTHRGWFADGSPRFEYHFTEGIHHGSVKEWHPNGRLFRWIEYENGEEQSQRIWRESGQIYANYIREDHRLRGLQGGKLCLTVKP